MIVVSLTMDPETTWVSPKKMSKTPVKPVPVMVTEVPPVAGPVFGLTLVTVGTAGAA